MDRQHKLWNGKLCACMLDCGLDCVLGYETLCMRLYDSGPLDSVGRLCW